MWINWPHWFENWWDSNSNNAFRPIDIVHQTEWKVANVFSTCISCWESCKWSLCDSCERDFQRGWYPDYFKWQSPKEKRFFASPLYLSWQSYEQSHFVLGSEQREKSQVYLLWIEKYDGFLVCILRISREIPWVHKWRRLWPDWKRDGEQTFTPKISRREEVYRVACDPNNLMEQEIVVYGWLTRNGKLIPDTEINYSSFLQIVWRIVEVWKYNLAQ
mgnify:CR=1 FL=1